MRIAKYTYHLFSSRDEDPVVIFLYDDQSTLVGKVCFVAEDKPLVAAEEAGGKVTLYFRRSQLVEVLDMLRNEGRRGGGRGRAGTEEDVTWPKR